MGKIKILSPLLRNKIAAGEVIERPASVVKELIENSIDAGSSRIDIVISGAGKKLIRVSDNGIGMSREDALLAFERYATSKIVGEEDLRSIKTLGFRGEALSSIASVAKVRLVSASKELGERTGVSVEISGGDLKDVKECPASGTIVEVRDLFFNTPARRKFLKSDSTENYHIIDTVTRQALSNYNIGFNLRVEEDEPLSLPPASNLRERLIQVYGKNFVDRMSEFELDGEGVFLTGFFGRPSDARSGRNNQFIFVNKRPVRDQSINHAVFRAYEDVIKQGLYPVFFIFMEIEPEKIDVNAHPSKREIRFEDKTGVYDLIFRAAREAIRGADGDFSFESMGEEISGTYSTAFSGYSISDNSCADCGVAALSEPQPMQYDSGVSAIYIGETFLAVPDGQGIMILDYHAAHERVNYERFLRKRSFDSQRLLFPQQIRLDAKDYQIVVRNMTFFREFGIEAEDFGHGTIIVRSLPSELLDADLGALFSDLAACVAESQSKVADHDNPIESLRRRIAARLACHSSVRGKEIPDSLRISAIIKDLESCDEPERCPHGRPTRIRINLSELRKMFKKQ